MYTIILVIHIIVSLILIGVVLMQTGKGAEMGAVFGGGSTQTVFGPTGPAGLLGKLTAGAAIIFMITSLTLAYMSGTAPKKTIMDDRPAATQEAPPRAMPPAGLPSELPSAKEGAKIPEGHPPIPGEKGMNKSKAPAKTPAPAPEKTPAKEGK